MASGERERELPMASWLIGQRGEIVREREVKTYIDCVLGRASPFSCCGSCSVTTDLYKCLSADHELSWQCRVSMSVCVCACVLTRGGFGVYIVESVLLQHLYSNCAETAFRNN